METTKHYDANITEAIQQSISRISGGFCQGMIARTPKKTYITAYHSEACFFSLPGAIIRSLYEQYQSVGGDFYDFKVYRDEIFKACYTVLKNKELTLTKGILCRDYAGGIPYPGRHLPKHTPIGVLDGFLDSMSLDDRLEALEMVLLDFNDREDTDDSRVIGVLSEVYEIIKNSNE